MEDSHMSRDAPLTLADVMTFEAAARALTAAGCRISKERVAEVAFRHAIAIPWSLERSQPPPPGTKRRRHWRVKLSDLQAAILGERTSPSRQREVKQQQTAPRVPRPLHPRVTC